MKHLGLIILLLLLGTLVGCQSKLAKQQFIRFDQDFGRHCLRLCGPDSVHTGTMINSRGQLECQCDGELPPEPIKKVKKHKRKSAPKPKK